MGAGFWSRLRRTHLCSIILFKIISIECKAYFDKERDHSTVPDRMQHPLYRLYEQVQAIQKSE